MLLRMMMAGGSGGLPPLANVDDFSTNTIASYTQTQDSGSPTWTVSGGKMNTSGAFGTQAILRRNSFSQADASVEVDCSAADDGGVVLRFQDQSNFYLMALADDLSGIGSGNNIRVFKRVGGTFTQLGSTVNVLWTRGTVKTFRFAMSGTTLTGYMDGALQFTITDSSIAAAGAVGMRAADSGVAYDAFRWG